MAFRIVRHARRLMLDYSAPDQPKTLFRRADLPQKLTASVADASPPRKKTR